MKRALIWIAWIAAVAAVGGTVAAAFQIRAKNGVETVTVSRGDLVKSVKVSGKVVAEESVELGFETNGIVRTVEKEVGDRVEEGDVVATLDSSIVSANLFRARAELASAEATLASLQGSDADTKLKSAAMTVSQAIDEAYSTVDDAIRNRIDQFFTDATTPNPRILPVFDDFSLRESVNSQRVSVETILRSWKASRPAISEARQNVARISSFLNDVSRAVNDFEPTTTLSQDMIDAYKADVSVARQNVNASASNLLAAEEGLRSDRSDVPVQAARVDAALASVLVYESELEKTSLVSPLSGVISRQNAKVGQAVSANEPLVSVISDGYKIEAFVPEVSIANIALDNIARVTLDAYGSEVEFLAIVARIDPAETVRDGVSNYKVELAFGEPDERIKPGMTANVVIETLHKPSALVIPARSAVRRGGGRFVLKKTDAGTVEVEIVAGEADSSGNIEVLSGLSEGDIILLDPVMK